MTHTIRFRLWTYWCISEINACTHIALPFVYHCFSFRYVSSWCFNMQRIIHQTNNNIWNASHICDILKLPSHTYTMYDIRWYLLGMEFYVWCIVCYFQSDCIWSLRSFYIHHLSEIFITIFGLICVAVDNKGNSVQQFMHHLRSHLRKFLAISNGEHTHT